MQLKHLSLTHFRNFTRLETSVQSGPTILVGGNAQGKTSLLEAIYFLTSATSPHTTSDRQIINFLTLQEERPFARIVAEIFARQRTHRIEIRLILDSVGIAGDQRLRKEILVNGIKRRVHQLAGVFNAVMFLPQHMLILEGSPGERRRHLDATFVQGDHVYAEALSDYAKILSQRNALLKRLQERKSSQQQLSFWDERLADRAALIIQKRAHALQTLQTFSDSIHQDLTRNKETLQLVYLPAFYTTRKKSGQLPVALETQPDWIAMQHAELVAHFLEIFQLSRREEIARGVTLSGPHRDDFQFLADGIDLKLYGSRGQNRTAMLSLLLAEVEWLKEKTGEWPVLLLDEVLAELDEYRRADLLNRITHVNQALLTSADISMFAPVFRESATIWQISSGTIMVP